MFFEGRPTAVFSGVIFFTFPFLFLAGLFTIVVGLLTYRNYQLRKVSKVQQELLRNQDDRLLDLAGKVQAAEIQKDLLSNRLKSQMEDALKRFADLERFRSMVEETDEFLYETDFKGRFLYVNPAMQKLLGYDLEELKKLDYFQFLRPADTEAVSQFYANQFKDKTQGAYGEWEIINRFGESVFIGLRTRMTFYPDGKIISVKGSARDLSLQTSKDLKNDLIDELVEHFLAKDIDGHLLLDAQPDRSEAVVKWANPKVLEMLGLTRFQTDGLSLVEISSALAEVVEDKIQNPEKNCIWVKSEKPLFELEVSARGGTGLLWVVLRDISNSRSLVKSLEERMALLQTIVDASGIEIALLNSMEEYHFFNPAFSENSGFLSSWIGKSDETIAKSGELDLGIALLRKTRMDEARLNQQRVRFEEISFDSNQNFRTKVREINTVSLPESQETGFLSLGLDVSAYQNDLQAIFENWDRAFFNCHPALNELPKGNKPIISTWMEEIGQEPLNPKSRNAFGKVRYVHFFPMTGDSFLEFLKDLPAPWSGLRFENQPDFPDGIFYFPHIIVEESIRWISRNDILKADRAQIHFQSNEEPNPKFRFRFLSTGNKPWNASTLKLLEKLSRFWAQCGLDLEIGEVYFEFSGPAILANRPETDKAQKTLQILKGKRIFAGPSQNRTVGGYLDNLSDHGADVVRLKSLLGVNKTLTEQQGHLLVWWGHDVSELRDLDKNLLREKGLRLLFYCNNPSSIGTSEWDASLIVKPRPADLKSAVEEAWLLAKSPQPPQKETVDESLDPISLKFGQVLEITEGDKNFMANLFDSYFKSLSDCQTDFEKHLKAGDVEGLNFLLHKIRATIKTFDIRILDSTLRASIEEIEKKKTLTENQVRKWVAKVNAICRQTEKELRAFAGKEGVPLR